MRKIFFLVALSVLFLSSILIMNVDQRIFSNIYKMITMNLKYIIILIICLGLFSCYKDSDTIGTKEWPIISQEVLMSSLSGFVISDPGNHNNLFFGSNWVYNATVKLIYEGEVIDQTITDKAGYFVFPNQPVPIKGAYLLIEKNGYFPNGKSISAESMGEFPVFYNMMLLVDSYLPNKEEGLSSYPTLVEVKGLFEYTNGNGQTPNRTMFALDKEGRVVGTALTGPDDGHFSISIPKNQEVNLYLDLTCTRIGPISVEFLQEDTDLGTIKYDDPTQNDKFYIEGSFDDCDDSPIKGGNVIMKYADDKINILTIGHDGVLPKFYLEECQVSSPFLSFLIYDNKQDIIPNNDQYKKIKLPHVVGNDAIISTTICKQNDTYYNYDLTSTSGEEIFEDAFIIANVHEDNSIDIMARGNWGIRKVIITSQGPMIANQFSGNLVHREGSKIQYEGASLIFNVISETDDYIDLEFSGQVIGFGSVPNSMIEGNIRAVKI